MPSFNVIIIVQDRVGHSGYIILYLYWRYVCVELMNREAGHKGSVVEELMDGVGNAI